MKRKEVVKRVSTVGFCIGLPLFVLLIVFSSYAFGTGMLADGYYSPTYLPGLIGDYHYEAIDAVRTSSTRMSDIKQVHQAGYYKITFDSAQSGYSCAVQLVLNLGTPPANTVGVAYHVAKDTFGNWWRASYVNSSYTAQHNTPDNVNTAVYKSSASSAMAGSGWYYKKILNPNYNYYMSIFNDEHVYTQCGHNDAIWEMSDFYWIVSGPPPTPTPSPTPIPLYEYGKTCTVYSGTVIGTVEFTETIEIDASLLRNGSFEDGNASQAEHWSVLGSGWERESNYEPYARDGEAVMALFDYKYGGTLSQSAFMPTDADKYKLAFSVRGTEGCSGSCSRTMIVKVGTTTLYEIEVESGEYASYSDIWDVGETLGVGGIGVGGLRFQVVADDTRDGGIYLDSVALYPLTEAGSLICVGSFLQEQQEELPQPPVLAVVTLPAVPTLPGAPALGTPGPIMSPVFNPIGLTPYPTICPGLDEATFNPIPGISFTLPGIEVCIEPTNLEFATPPALEYYGLNVQTVLSVIFTGALGLVLLRMYMRR